MTAPLREADLTRLRALHTLGRTTTNQLASSYPEHNAQRWREWLTRMVQRGFVHGVCYGNPPRVEYEYEISAKALRALARTETPTGTVAQPRTAGDWRFSVLTQPKWEPARPGADDANRIPSRGL